MDDIILTSNDKGERELLKEKLALEFKMKDVESLHYFLEMEVGRSCEGISISQRKYVLDLLKETSMIGCKPANTPMDPNTKLSTKLAQGPMNKGRYHRLVGKLIYLSHTRSDIAFTISYVSQFMHQPLGEHMEAVHKILRYIKGTFGRSLFFRKTMGRSIEVYTNVESSTKVELREITHALCKILWLKMIVEELKVMVKKPMEVYCDNKVTINISHSLVHQDSTKPVEVDHHFFKEKIDEGIVCITYIPTTK
ncbi:hypothetical protein AAG906_000994 [Vitis piasezkii]